MGRNNKIHETHLLRIPAKILINVVGFNHMNHQIFSHSLQDIVLVEFHLLISDKSNILENEQRNR